MTHVYLTIDTECREERRAGERFLPAAGYDLRVWGRFTNQQQELGIDLLMRELEACDLRGTFYLDPFGAEYFGREELARVCEELLSRGHDVQLHAHPIQQEPDWITRGAEPLSDDMADYSLEQQTELLSRGVEILAASGVPRSSLVSFRAGNFGANNDTWRAMKAVGLTVSSNYNPCYLSRNSRLHWPELEVELFDTGEGVWELPISNFREKSGGYRHLQITAISLAEMKALLLQAHQLGIREICIVTHSFEFMHLDSVPERLGRINRINFHRLRGLCRFLEEHPHLFTVETVGALGRRLPERREDNKHRCPVGQRRYRYLRFVEQAYKRLEVKARF